MNTRIGPWAGNRCAACSTAWWRGRRDAAASLPASPAALSALALLARLIAVHFLEQAESLLQVRLKILPHEIEHAADEAIAQGIEDLIAVLAAHDDLLGAEDGEVLRHVGLFEPQLVVD